MFSRDEIRRREREVDEERAKKDQQARQAMLFSELTAQPVQSRLPALFKRQREREDTLRKETTNQQPALPPTESEFVQTSQQPTTAPWSAPPEVQPLQIPEHPTNAPQHHQQFASGDAEPALSPPEAESEQCMEVEKRPAQALAQPEDTGTHQQLAPPTTGPTPIRHSDGTLSEESRMASVQAQSVNTVNDQQTLPLAEAAQSQLPSQIATSTSYSPGSIHPLIHPNVVNTQPDEVQPSSVSQPHLPIVRQATMPGGFPRASGAEHQLIRRPSGARAGPSAKVLGKRPAVDGSDKARIVPEGQNELIRSRNSALEGEIASLRVANAVAGGNLEALLQQNAFLQEQINALLTRDSREVSNDPQDMNIDDTNSDQQASERRTADEDTRENGDAAMHDFAFFAAVGAPQSASSVPASQPPSSVHAPQPPTSVPAPQPPTSVPAAQPATSVPAPQPPTSVPAPQPPTSVPAPRSSTSVPAPQPPNSTSSPDITMGPPSQILPTGAIRPFIGPARAAPPAPPGRHRNVRTEPELISRIEPEPEETWTNIGPTPFEGPQWNAWMSYKKPPRRPLAKVTSFTEHCRAIEREFTSRLPETQPDPPTHNYQELPDCSDIMEGLNDSQRETVRRFDKMLDRRFGIALGGRSASAIRNPYRHTPYGMPTELNKKTKTGALERYRATVNSHPNWERNGWNSKVRAIYYHFLRISCLKDVRNRAPVTTEMRLKWENEQGPEPSLFRLQFDWLGGTKSAWNIMFFGKIFELLRIEYNRLGEQWALDWYSDEHIQLIIQMKFENLAREWKDGQQRNGETLPQTLTRLLDKRKLAEKRARENVRRNYKYTTRLHIAKCSIEMRERALHRLKTSHIQIESDAIRTLNDDLRVWNMARNIILRLGTGGMSSEDSCEEDGEVVYRVKIMVWRRRMEQLLRLIDRQRIDDSSMYTPRGSKGVKRLRIPEGTLESDWQWKTRRIHQEGLPEILYDPDWLQNIMGDRALLSFTVSREEFQFFDILSWRESDLGEDDGIEY